MKYEITKGSEKDFEGAPDWCLQVIRPKGGTRLGFVKELDYMCAVHCTELGENGRVSNPTLFEIIAERRPITEPVVNQQLTTEWDGQGLPPVGAECELKSEEYGDYHWVKVRVVFEHNGELIVIVNMPDEPIHDKMSKHSAGYDGAKFRPLRSPEDVARAEAIDWLIEKIMRILGHNISLETSLKFRELAVSIYDAGYRKMEWPMTEAESSRSCLNAFIMPR